MTVEIQELSNHFLDTVDQSTDIQYDQKNLKIMLIEFVSFSSVLVITHGLLLVSVSCHVKWLCSLCVFMMLT